MESSKCRLCGYIVTFDSLGGLCLQCSAKIIKDYDNVIIKISLLETELKEERERSLMLLSELRKLNSHDPSQKFMKYNDNLIGALGSDFDTELAKKFNIHSSTISRLRQSYSIPAFDPDRELWKLIDPVIFDKSIRKLAKEFNIGRGKIDRRRKKILKIKGENFKKITI